MGNEHDVSTRHLHVTGGITSSFIGLARVERCRHSTNLRFFERWKWKSSNQKGGDHHRHVTLTYLHVMLMQRKSAYQYEICCIITESIWNDWLGNKLDFDFSLAAEPWPFFADTFPRDIGARWFQGPSRDQLLWKLEWYGKLMSWWEQTGATESYLWFLTEKIVWGFTAVTR